MRSSLLSLSDHFQLAERSRKRCVWLCDGAPSSGRPNGWSDCKVMDAADSIRGHVQQWKACRKLLTIWN
jgi:hypothetical protein